MDKLECALKDVPQSIINQIITEQLKKKVRDFLEDGDADKLLDRIVEDLIIKYCKSKAAKIVAEYLEKDGSMIITRAVKACVEDDGIPDVAYNHIINGIDDYVKSKFKKGGKK